MVDKCDGIRKAPSISNCNSTVARPERSGRPGALTFSHYGGGAPPVSTASPRSVWTMLDSTGIWSSSALERLLTTLLPWLLIFVT